MRNDEMYLQLYIIRHGESMGNIETDDDFDKVNPPLTELGKMQALALGERFKKLDNYTLYASPLVRARETAAAISDKIIIDSDLLEHDVRATENGFENFEETYEECIERARRVIEKFKAKHHNHENVIVVCHGVFAQFLLKAALNLDNTMRFSVYNASVSKVNFCDDELPKLALQNDISHLRETDGEKLFWM